MIILPLRSPLIWLFGIFMLCINVLSSDSAVKRAEKRSLLILPSHWKPNFIVGYSILCFE